MANTLFFSAPHTLILSHKKISVPSNTVCIDRYSFSRRNQLTYVSSALRARYNSRAFKENLSKLTQNVTVQSRIRAYHMRCDDSEEEEDYQKVFYDEKAHFYKDFAAYLSRVWMQSSLAEKYYHKAMEIEPCNRHLLREFAEFAWDKLGNPNKAKEIYEFALQEHPEDVKLLGSYAFFLWKVEG